MLCIVQITPSSHDTESQFLELLDARVRSIASRESVDSVQQRNIISSHQEKLQQRKVMSEIDHEAELVKKYPALFDDSDSDSDRN